SCVPKATGPLSWPRRLKDKASEPVLLPSRMDEPLRIEAAAFSSSLPGRQRLCRHRSWLTAGGGDFRTFFGIPLDVCLAPFTRNRAGRAASSHGRHLWNFHPLVFRFGLLC